jgi:AcrR family transcriptional regulator
MAGVGGAPVELLDAAERLIGARGVEGVSLREIGAAAGHRNNSAAQYHFGTKERLLAAVFERRMAPINERRLELLAAVADGDVRGIVEAWWRPFVEAVLVDPPTGYGGFVAQVVSHPAFEAFRTEAREVTAGLDEVVRRLAAALPELPPRVLNTRLRLVSLAACNLVADHERRIVDGGRPPGVDAVVATLADALTGLLTAPVTQGASR